MEATVTNFINTQDETVLFGFQVDKIVGRKGPGGKLKDGQSEEDNAFEEVAEETGGKKELRLNPDQDGGIVFDKKDLIPVAVITFYNGEDKNSFFIVKFFNCYIFSGKAIDTLEMRDWKHYPINNLPFHEMPAGDELYMRDILEGKCRKGWILRTKDKKTVLDHKIEPCESHELIIKSPII